MSDFRCCCDPKELLWKGCTCKPHPKRTMSIYLAMSCIGWRKGWDIVYAHAPYSLLPKKSPEEEIDMRVLLTLIEIQSPDLFDELARKFEEAVGKKEVKAETTTYAAFKDDDHW